MFYSHTTGKKKKLKDASTLEMLALFNNVSFNNLLSYHSN